jgi:hypothetical protein
MTERPTEQTHQRLTGLGAPVPEARSASPSAPTLPPMPPDLHSTERTPLAERLQQRMHAVRQAATGHSDAPNGTPTAAAAGTQTANAAGSASARPVDGRAETTTPHAVRPEIAAASAAATAAPVAPVSPTHEGPVLPPPAADQEPSAPAGRQQQKRRPARAAKVKRPPRRARLRLTRIDPWSVMKTAFLLSIALGVVTIVSVLMVWSVLGAAGVWDSINTTVRDIVGDQANQPFTIQDYLGTDRVIGFTMLVAVIDVVLLTAIATLAAFLYNMAAALLGGIDITLVEDER